MEFEFEIRLDAAQIFGERVHFLAPYLVAEEELAVEIRFVHGVEIGYDELSHAGPYEMHGAVRTEPARAGYADDGVFEQVPLPLVEICVCAHHPPETIL